MKRTCGYAGLVKTAVSLPDDIFRRAERVARKLGVSRSELYTRAITAYLKSFETAAVRKALDEIYTAEPAQLAPLFSRMQSASIPSESWE